MDNIRFMATLACASPLMMYRQGQRGEVKITQEIPSGDTGGSTELENVLHSVFKLYM